MKRVLFSETVTTTVEVSETPVDGVVLAEYCSPTNPIARFAVMEELQKLDSLADARQHIARCGMQAVTAAGLKKLVSVDLDALSHADALTDEDVVTDPRRITAGMLIQDARWKDGFVYRHGHDTPLSTPLGGFLCQSTTDMSAELIAALVAHPWVITDGETDYVPGNGKSLDLWVQLPQPVFDGLYEELATRKNDRYFGSHRLWDEVIGMGSYKDEPGEFDVLRIHDLMQPGSLDEDDYYM